MPRSIYLEPVLKYHAFARQLQEFPPDGYEVVVPNTPQQAVYTVGAYGQIGAYLLHATDTVFPTGLLRALLNTWSHAPVGSVTYSTDQLVFRKEPWVVEVEYASALLGINAKHLRRYKGMLERVLSSPYCRMIRCWAEVGMRSLLEDLDSSGFAHKIRLIPCGIAPKNFTKTYKNTGKVKLLFVGSGTSNSAFHFRGGREALEVFIQLRKQYSNVEMVIRSDIPADVKAKYGSMEDLRIIDTNIPQQELAREFQAADIFIIPSHNTSPMIMLDAMSCELPLVTTDAWANAEYAENGKTGLVVSKSPRVQYYYADTCQPNYAAKEFIKGIETPDPEVVAELAKMVGSLIENPELRRKLGRAARWEVEHGKFSLTRMNQKLGHIFDEAIGGVWS